jgi:hypothetical protein
MSSDLLHLAGLCGAAVGRSMLLAALADQESSFELLGLACPGERRHSGVPVAGDLEMSFTVRPEGASQRPIAPVLNEIYSTRTDIERASIKSQHDFVTPSP